MESLSTVSAIYDMREAAEQKARAEILAVLKDTPENRNSLLEAQLALETKTQDAIEACTEHHCSEGCAEHAAPAARSTTSSASVEAAPRQGGSSNVVDLQSWRKSS